MTKPDRQGEGQPRVLPHAFTASEPMNRSTGQRVRKERSLPPARLTVWVPPGRAIHQQQQIQVRTQVHSLVLPVGICWLAAGFDRIIDEPSQHAGNHRRTAAVHAHDKDGAPQLSHSFAELVAFEARDFSTETTLTSRSKHPDQRRS